MEGNIAATYTLIYRFLKQQSQNKAAEAVKKAAKAFVVLHDGIEHKGPPLEDIVQTWRTKEDTKSGDADSSSEDSDSSDDSSSDSGDSSSSDASSKDTSGSDSEDDTSDSDEGTKAEKLPLKAAERDTSATLSSGGVPEVAKKVIQIPEKKSTKDKNKGSGSDSSDSDSSDSDSSSKSSTSDGSDAESSPSSSDSSSDSDSSDEEEAKKAPPKTEDKGSSTSESSSDSEDESDSSSQHEEDAPVVKKRKTSENGAAVTTAVASGSQQLARASQGKVKPPLKVRERFQRVKVQNLAPDLLLDNGYEARRGATNDYGDRAHRDLIVTRGSGFRKEKNKKKRGSYRGGEITVSSMFLLLICLISILGRWRVIASSLTFRVATPCLHRVCHDKHRAKTDLTGLSIHLFDSTGTDECKPRARSQQHGIALNQCRSSLTCANNACLFMSNGPKRSYSCRIQRADPLH
jgi:hypothetical protein